MNENDTPRHYVRILGHWPAWAGEKEDGTILRTCNPQSLMFYLSYYKMFKSPEKGKDPNINVYHLYSPPLLSFLFIIYTVAQRFENFWYHNTFLLRIRIFSANNDNFIQPKKEIPPKITSHTAHIQTLPTMSVIEFCFQNKSTILSSCNSFGSWQLFLLFVCCLRHGLHISMNGLKLETILLLLFPNADISGICQHAWLDGCLLGFVSMK